MSETEPEGGDNWQQQSGYGERVLDPDHVDEPSDAATDAADHADHVQEPDEPSSHQPAPERSVPDPEV